MVAEATAAQWSPKWPGPNHGFQPVVRGTPIKWEIDTNRKIDSGKKQWDDKIKTFLVSKDSWQQEIKQAALEKMLAATGSSLNERLPALSEASSTTVKIPEMNINSIVASAVSD